MSAIIDVVLDAQNEVTPVFEIAYPPEGQGRGMFGFCHIAIQGTRVTGNTAVDLEIQESIVGADGSVSWVEERTGDVSVTASHTAGQGDIQYINPIIPGVRYRVRYGTNATDEIRVRVAAPYGRVVT